MTGFSKPNAGAGPIRLSDERDFVLAGLEVWPSLREVRFDGRKEQLEPRVMQVLVALSSAGGAVVSRDELIRRCWEGRIVGEAAINRCVSKLRELLEAGGQTSFRIETIARVGYRLVPGEGMLQEAEPTGNLAEIKSVPAIAHRMTRSALYLLLGAAVLIVAAFLGYRIRSPHVAPRPPSQEISEPSIAVLPFKNLSSDKGAGYLAAGVQDEILTRLAKIGSLKVISRTSADQYANKPGNLPEIARRLGVANILEGSVQREGNTVRINVQLIRAAGDDHLWAEDYDRKMDDVFSVESDVADAIATALAAKVTPGERKEIAQQPTSDPRAYDLYLRGLVFARKNDDSSLRTAVQLFTDATRADPKFALAWSWLAREQAYIHFGDDLATVRRGEAHAALAKALELAPDLAEAHVATGFYLYYGEMNYPAAQRELEHVQARWPNNAAALEALALVLRRQGKWRESTDDLIRLVALDPLVPIHRLNLATNLIDQHDFPKAMRVIDDALGFWPDNNWLLATKASAYQDMGQLDQAGVILKNVYPAPDDGGVFWPIWQQFWLQRQYAKGAVFFRGMMAQDPDESTPTFALLRCALGDFLRMAADTKASMQNYSAALVYIQRNLKKHPNNPDLLEPLAIIYAGLGEPEMAARSADRTVDLLRTSGDAFESTGAESERARIMARLGNRGNAITELGRLLKLPGELTPALLRLDPDFDALRGDPRFQRLLLNNSTP